MWINNDHFETAVEENFNEIINLIEYATISSFEKGLKDVLDQLEIGECFDYICLTSKYLKPIRAAFLRKNHKLIKLATEQLAEKLKEGNMHAIKFVLTARGGYMLKLIGKQEQDRIYISNEFGVSDDDIKDVF